MRIGIDARPLTGRYTGDRTYWLGLTHSLAREFPGDELILYSRAPIPAQDAPAGPGVRLTAVPARSERIWSTFAFPAALRRDGVDIAHTQYTTPPRLLMPCPIITTVHDISFRLHPEWFPRRHGALLNLTVPGSMERACRVITDSESSRRDILATYRLRPEKVAAILLGLTSPFDAIAIAPEPPDRHAAIRELADRHGISAPFMLAVGVQQPRKNLKVLAEAFGIARARFGIPHRLVLAGKPGWGPEQADLRAAAGRAGGTEAAAAILFPGYLPDSELPLWYTAAELYAHPALYEGFGFPPLEAMACGTPVLSSDQPCLPEIVGDAAIEASASDPEAWADSMGRALFDQELRAALRERGRARAREFRWDRAAAETRALYAAALNR